MDLRSYLDGMGVRYEWLHHDSDAYTAQDLAMMEHVSGKRVVKPVVVEADGQFVLCALPASCYIDMERLREELHANTAKLADEDALRGLFPDSELGAEPPIGRMYGMETIVDESLSKQDEVVLQAGTHRDAVRMSFGDYMRVARPRVVRFGKSRA
jgi:Ala-tRNA(Pro) deacylase